MKSSQKSNKQPITSIVFLVLFACWIVFALISILYNVAKSVSEEKTWGTLTDTQKKYVLFGDVYSFFMFVKNNTLPTASVILYPHTEELFYRGIYELYPRKMTTATTKSALIKDIQTIKPDFVAIYNSPITIDSYQEIASFSGQNHNFGMLYKRL
ncbi:MAG: hypothetical protein KGL95_11555 [Patescibacteria group bacterium]|nr:hypothetical protein [Patescibacteria group bacterium]